MTRKPFLAISKRLIGMSVLLVCIGGLIYLVAQSFRDNLVFFFTPSEIAQKYKAHDAGLEKTIRLGGLVKEGSIQIIDEKSRVLTFVVTDMESSMTVQYKGFLPDLFREGQGVVALGKLNADATIFYAQTLLAKHDENYKPPQLKKALARQSRQKVAATSSEENSPTFSPTNRGKK